MGAEAAEPGLGAVADGERLENVLKAHRKGVPAGASQSVSAGQFPSTSP